MNKYLLSAGAVRLIHRAVDDLYDRAKVRALGPGSVGKRIYVGYNPDLSLPGLFIAANREERVKPDDHLMASLMRVAEGYLDSQRELTKAKVVHAVDAFLQDAQANHVDTDVETVLGGELSKVWKKATEDIQRVVSTESNKVKNTGLLDGILRVNAASGISDPVVAWIGPNDEDTCEECKRLFLLEDEMTPRVWKLSEAGNRYHKKGEDSPKIGGLHPHCRHSMVTIMPGYGFDYDGKLQYIGGDHDELKRQRDLQ